MNVTGNGVFVDVNCEVRGYLSPMDIDLNASPEGLYKGFEALRAPETSLRVEDPSLKSLERCES